MSGPGGVDLQQVKGPVLQLRRLREHRNAVVGSGRNRRLVQRQRGQVGERRREAVDRKPVGVLLSAALAFALSETLAGSTGELRCARAPGRDPPTRRAPAGSAAARPSS